MLPLLRPLVAPLILGLVCATPLLPAHADDRARAASPSVETTLELALESVGIEPLLEGVLPALDAELASLCGARQAALRSETFATAALLQRFTRSLQQHDDAAMLDGVQRWYASAEGRAVARAESDAASLSDDAVAEAYPAIVEQAGWPQRKALVRGTLHGSRTAAFLTRYHSGVDGIVAASRQCNPDTADLAELAAARTKSQQDESFVGFFIDVELIAPTAVIYAELPDPVLQAYTDFAASPAGSAWFAALHQALTDTLDNARDAFMDARRDIADETVAEDSER